VLRGFIHAQNTALESLGELAADDDARRRMRELLVLNKREGFAVLEQLRKGFPEVAKRAETHSAFRTLLIQKKVMIEDLRDRALLDEAEAERLMVLLGEVLRQRHYLPVDRSPLPEPHALLRDCEWTHMLNDTAISYLVEAVEQRIYEPGEVIMAQGRGVDGLFIIARGVVERVHHDEGVAKTVDLLGPGGLAGLGALMVGTQRTELRALSAVDLLWIPHRRLEALMNQDPQLKAALAESVEG